MNPKDCKDLYQRLNISKNASMTEIQKAYYEESKKWHPDATGKDTNFEFNAITEAYNTLFDHKKRTDYDSNWELRVFFSQIFKSNKTKSKSKPINTSYIDNVSLSQNYTNLSSQNLSQRRLEKMVKNENIRRFGVYTKSSQGYVLNQTL